MESRTMEFKEEIVISGVSGRYPECQNVEEFKEALLSGKELMTVDERRFPAAIKGVPRRTGKIPEIDKFDATFFGIHSKQANLLDPRHRILLETTFEAIIDAGYNPSELRGSKTGVFVGMAMINATKLPEETNEYYHLVIAPYHAANRIAYCFDFKGPSFTMDTACSGSLYAFTVAYEKLKSGEIDNAIVGGANINLNPQEAFELAQMGLLDPDGKTRIFNKNRNGFCRSEVVCSYFLQRKSKSRRIYATIIGAKSNTDGYKKEGFSHPSSDMQSQLIRELYAETNIDPNDLAYVEMHGTGTIVGDVVETKSIVDIFGGKRKEPLLVGSVKSNMGHAEGGSGVASLTKVVVAMESGLIPATINAEPIDPNLTAISKGTVQVVTTNTELKNGLIGISSFGICGANAHVVLKPTAHKKLKRVDQKRCRLVQVSGRTEDAVSSFLDEIEQTPADEEFLNLIDEIHKTNIEGYDYRGYTVLGKNSVRQIAKYKSEKRPIWFIFSGLGSQWPGMAKDLMHIEVFRNTFQRCAKALKPHGVDLESIIMDSTPTLLQNIVNVFSSIGAITIALIDLLASLDITPDFMAGHSLGEVGCAYADGGMTPEQAVLLAFARGNATTQANLPRCQMAAIGLSAEALQDILPEGIYVVCVNSKASTTIGGLEKPTKDFVQKLTEQGIFARLVDTGNVAFHSPYLKDTAKYLHDFAKTVLTDPKSRSDRWISTSVPEGKDNEKWARYNCAEYHVNNYENRVYFDNIYKHIQKNAVVIEISPHGLLQAILKRELGTENTLISLLNRNAADQEEYLLSSIGKIFNAGGQPNLRNLYKGVTFPVSRGTKMLSPLLKWDHTTSWFVPLWKNKYYFGKAVIINLSNEKYSYLSGHNIDGRILMPAAGYLELVWTVLAEKNLKDINEMPVVIENVRFSRTVVLAENKNVELIVNIMRKSGNFEILEGGSVVVTGKIHKAEDVAKEFTKRDLLDQGVHSDLILKTEDIYKEFHLRRYMYSGLFRGISECNLNGTVAEIRWNNKFTSFIDTMLQLGLTEIKTKDLFVPTEIKRVVIDPRVHLEDVQNNYSTVVRDPYYNVFKSKGIEIFCPKMTVVPRRKKIQTDASLDSIEFVCYNSPINKKYDFDTSLVIATNIIAQNINGLVKILHIGQIKNEEDPMNEHISSKIKDGFRKKILTKVDYSSITANNIDHKFNVIVIDEVTSKEYEEPILSNIEMRTFIVCIGAYAGKQLSNLDVIFHTPSLSLLRLKQNCVRYNDVIEIKNYSDYKWLDKLKQTAKSTDPQNVLLYSQKEETSGIIGLMFCLQTEGTKVEFKSVFVDKDAPAFSVNDKFYKQQLSKNLAFNVLSNNNWGTFIPIPLEDIKTRTVENAALSIRTLGDLSTLCWIETPILTSGASSEDLVNASYLGLNFKDVMIATGKIHSNKGNEVKIGLEYSGTTLSGKRVMGIINESFNLQLKTDPYFIWEVPKSWSLAQAATIPAAYITSYYGMVVRGHMEQNESILIHAGSGAVGISAIRIALSLKATIFTTVSTDKKKQFLINLFPQLDESNIGNSRDSSFYNLIKRKTKGRGVDIVLNSLSGELFQMSVNCLAQEGRFLEIGKVDLIGGSVIDTGIFLKNCSFHGIMVDELFGNIKIQTKIQDLIQKGIASGVVQPMPHTVFESEEVEAAFRFLSTGKHTGKVLVQIKQDPLSHTCNIPSYPKISFSPEKVYIIVGGLGGMGLELAHWLFSKGARKVVLNSRRKIWNGYQTFCMDTWSKLKYLALIDLNDTTSMAGSQKLITEAQKYGPIGGIFNTALVLRDAPIREQTSTDFEEVFKPKVNASDNLDVITRKCCPQLDHFVLFSSIVASRGVIGQTNYGMANSVLERLCEKRRRDNLPGLAVEWGPIADVGVLTNDHFNKRHYVDILHQKIESCWETLETFMIQNVTVGVSVVYEENLIQSKKEKTPIDMIGLILGVDNIDAVDKGKSLHNFGIDSLMVAEIKQIIYQEYQQEIELDDIRKLTFEALHDLNRSKNQ